jgi:sRNA-binding regulator protein Hfq
MSNPKPDWKTQLASGVKPTPAPAPHGAAPPLTSKPPAPAPAVPAKQAPAKPPAEPEIDNALYNEARRNRTTLRFVLRGGREIVGTVRSFSRFAVDVISATPAGTRRVLIHKHAIDTVEAHVA